MIIANVLGEFADEVFHLNSSQLSSSTAWLGITCYTLQIYFDFSGYSDMAIGLARMFGFEFLENFNYPYISRSMREFWQRWHLSLSTWFRDYVYIPLGGNRMSPLRVNLNLFAVFLLCGFWHGASWNFIIWGALHGSLLVMERGRIGKFIDAMPRIFAHIYVMLFVSIGWVFFKADTLSAAKIYLRALTGFAKTSEMPITIAIQLDNYLICIMLLAIALSTPIFTWLARDFENRRFPAHANKPYSTVAGNYMKMMLSNNVLAIARPIVMITILILSMSYLASDSYNPFIYFRF